MAITERLALLITADTNQAVKSLHDVERASDRSLGSVESRNERMAAGFKKAGAIMLTGGTLAAAGLYKAAQASSDLAEAQNLTTQIFGEGAGEIADAAEEAADAVGMSERSYREATATIGGLLQNLGFASDETLKWSKDLAVLASDMGSAFNADPAEAVQAIGSALRGETEPIRRFNVMLSAQAADAKAVELGLASSAKEVEGFARAQGTLALIMEQTNAIQGDFENTADGAANAQRRFNAHLEEFQASLGEGALPVLQEFLSAGNSALGWFNDLDGGTKSAISSTLTWATGLSLAAGGLSMAKGKAMEYRASLAAASATTGEGITKMQKMKGAAVGMSAALAGAAVAWGAYQSVMSNSRAEGAAAAEGWKQQAMEVDSFAEMAAKANAASAELERNKPEGGWWSDFANADSNAAFNEAQAGLNSFIGDLNRMFPVADELTAKYGMTKEAALDWLASQYQLGIEFKTGKTAIEAYGAQVDTTKGSTLEAAQAYEAAEEALEGYHNSLKAAVNPFFALNDAQRKNQEAQQELQDLHNEGVFYGADYDAVLQKIASSAIDVQVASDELAFAMEHNGASVEGATAVLGDLADKGLMTEGVLDSLADGLEYTKIAADNWSGDYYMRLHADTAQAYTNITEVNAAIDNLAAKTAAGTQVMLGGIPVAGISGPGQAMGGRVPGPRGKPVFIKAHGGETVLDAGTTDRMQRASTVGSSVGGGGTVNLTINAMGSVDQAAAKQIVDAVRRASIGAAGRRA